MDIHENIMFRNFDVKLADTVNLAVKLFNDSRYYNVDSRIFVHGSSAGTHTNFHEEKSEGLRWIPPPEGWTKINVDASMSLQGLLL